MSLPGTVPTYIIFHRLETFITTLAAVPDSKCHMVVMRRHEGCLVPVLLHPDAIHGDICFFFTAQVAVGEGENRHLETYGINVVSETVPRLDDPAKRGMASSYWSIEQPNPYDVFSRRVVFPEPPEGQKQTDAGNQSQEPTRTA